MEKFVYSFNEGSKDMRSLLGGKGANLAEMTKIQRMLVKTISTKAEFYQKILLRKCMTILRNLST